MQQGLPLRCEWLAPAALHVLLLAWPLACPVSTRVAPQAAILSQAPTGPPGRTARAPEVLEDQVPPSQLREPSPAPRRGLAGTLPRGNSIPKFSPRVSGPMPCADTRSGPPLVNHWLVGLPPCGQPHEGKEAWLNSLPRSPYCHSGQSVILIPYLQMKKPRLRRAILHLRSHSRFQAVGDPVSMPCVVTIACGMNK